MTFYHPVFSYFEGDSFPISGLRENCFINSYEEKWLEAVKHQMGQNNTKDVPFFQGDRPEVFVPFSVLKQMGFMPHFYEFHMFKMMDEMYYPMRMKILQKNVSALAETAQNAHWQQLDEVLNDKSTKAIGKKEMATVFAVSQSLEDIRYFLQKNKEKTPAYERLAKEYVSMEKEFNKQMKGLPEFYYYWVYMDYPSICRHTDDVFEENIQNFVLKASTCFEFKENIISSKEKNEKIISLARLADKALFYNPYIEKTRVAMFDLTFDFPKTIKRTYERIEQEEFIKRVQEQLRSR